LARSYAAPELEVRADHCYRSATGAALR
jgi:hypothetical protein